MCENRISSSRTPGRYNVHVYTYVRVYVYLCIYVYEPNLQFIHNWRVISVTVHSYVYIYMAHSL